MKHLPVLLIAAFALILGACAPTRIGRVLADPMRYQNRSVTVEGRVTGSVGAFVAGGYQVDDGTGKIYVVTTRGGVPSQGASVKVSGHVTPGITIMGHNIGTAIQERHRRTRF